MQEETDMDTKKTILLVIAAIYFFSPIDFIPGSVIDDLIVFALASLA